MLIDFSNALINTLLKLFFGVDSYLTQTLFRHFPKEAFDEVKPGAGFGVNTNSNLPSTLMH